MSNLSSEFEQLKSKIARSMKEVLTNEVRTPEGERTVACDIHIPYHHLLPDDDEAGAAQATVTYVTHTPTEKRHTVYVKFKYDKSGKFQRNTMTYV